MAVYQIDVANCLTSLSGALTSSGAATVLFSDANTLIVQPESGRFDKPVKFTVVYGAVIIQTGAGWVSGANLTAPTKDLTKYARTTATLQSCRLVVSSATIAVLQTALYNATTYYATTVMAQNADGGLCWTVATTPDTSTLHGYAGLPLIRTSDWAQMDIMQFATTIGALASADGFYVQHDLIIRSATGVMIAGPTGVKMLLQPPAANTVQLTQVGDDVVTQTGGTQANTTYFLWNTVIVGGGV